ncbi:MAG: protein kinase [Sandaracinus sp.]|nr:protein kinase [Sandaracinus sp.]
MQVVLASPEARVGSRVDGRYRLTALLGRGGMGVVYEAVHEQTGRTVALKTLHPSLARDEMATQRFLREIRTAGMFEHPNLTEVLDAGTDTDGTLYVVMPRLRGRTLDEILQSGPLEPELTAGVMLPLLEALAFMHARGAIHRDLKPSNVFLHVDGNGTTIVKILDFGLARIVVQERGASTQAVIGTPHYMAPEQARGRGGVGAAADVWSAGVLAYECLVGDVPFGGTTTEALAAILSGQAIPAMPATVPFPFARVVSRALERDPEARPQNAAAWMAQWQEALFEARLRPALPRFTMPRLPEPVATDTPTVPSEPDRPEELATQEGPKRGTPSGPIAPAVNDNDSPPPMAAPKRSSLRWAGGVGVLLLVAAAAWLTTRGGVPSPVEAASPPDLSVVDAGLDGGRDAGPDDAGAPDAQLPDAGVAEPIPSEPRPAEPVRRRRPSVSEAASSSTARSEPAAMAEPEGTASMAAEPERTPRTTTGPNGTPIVPWR